MKGDRTMAVVAAGVTLLVGGSARAAEKVQLVDVTRAAGIHFRHVTGAFGKKYLPETMGAGVVILDYDNDGWQDVFLVNSTRWPGHPGRRGRAALYRNNHDGTFRDVTRATGLAIEIYGLGATAADYDNDGWQDIYVTALGRNRLFRNRGGRFVDVTAQAGVGDPGFSISATFLDYDRDGRLDLFVCNYVEWSIDKDLFCTLDGQNKSYCTPESYRGQSPRLYRGRADGTFEDVTRRTGIEDSSSKALGVAVLDFDGDGWLDLFVANDTQPNKLYRNDAGRRFVDVAVQGGVAFSEAGIARAGMGVDAADYDGSGLPGLIVGNFSSEMMGLYHNEGNGLFIDEAPATTIGEATFLMLTFGCFFFDYDLDGQIDILGANGHVADDVAAIHPQIGYAQPPHLLRNLGAKRFDDVSRQVGAGFSAPLVARGAAYGDLDNDGDLDVVLTANGGPARVLRNDGGNRNGWVRVRLVGRKGNRDGIGARIVLKEADGTRRWARVKTGSSYASRSELPVTFGLGSRGRATRLEVIWPGGGRDVVSDPPARRELTVIEGQGLTRRLHARHRGCRTSHTAPAALSRTPRLTAWPGVASQR